MSWPHLGACLGRVSCFHLLLNNHLRHRRIQSGCPRLKKTEHALYRSIHDDIELYSARLTSINSENHRKANTIQNRIIGRTVNTMSVQLSPPQTSTNPPPPPPPKNILKTSIGEWKPPPPLPGPSLIALKLEIN